MPAASARSAGWTSRSVGPAPPPLQLAPDGGGRGAPPIRSARPPRELGMVATWNSSGGPGGAAGPLRPPRPWPVRGRRPASATRDGTPERSARDRPTIRPARGSAAERVGQVLAGVEDAALAEPVPAEELLGGRRGELEGRRASPPPPPLAGLGRLGSCRIPVNGAEEAHGSRGPPRRPGKDRVSKVLPWPTIGGERPESP